MALRVEGRGKRGLSGAAWMVMVLLFVGTALLVADETLKMSLKDYLKAGQEAASPEAYERALARLAKVELGIRSHQFFIRMEMLYLKDKSGKPVDGFCEGHLRQESQELAKSGAEQVLVFGYYKDWKKQKNPVRKFLVVFRNKVLQEIKFFDPKDDVHGIGGKLGK